MHVSQCADTDKFLKSSGSLPNHLINKSAIHRLIHVALICSDFEKIKSLIYSEYCSIIIRLLKSYGRKGAHFDAGRSMADHLSSYAEKHHNDAEF
jgi:hypothetical protein